MSAGWDEHQEIYGGGLRGLKKGEESTLVIPNGHSLATVGWEERRVSTHSA